MTQAPANPRSLCFPKTYCKGQRTVCSALSLAVSPFFQRSEVFGEKDPRSEDAEHFKALRHDPGQRQVLAGHLPGRDSRAAGRERQRQDDADEHALGYLFPRRGRDLHRRQARRDPLAQGRVRSRHRHDPPALQARGRADGDGEHRARARGQAGSQGGREEDPRDLRHLRLRSTAARTS